MEGGRNTPDCTHLLGHTTITKTSSIDIFSINHSIMEYI